jgi:tetratricopeptide (TPR) repeat protein
VDALRRFEVAVFTNGEHGDDPLPILAAVERTVDERLAGHHHDSLAPLLLLHLEVSERHAANGNLRLASHARDRVIALAELYAATGGSETAARLASDALGAVGSYLQGTNRLTQGRNVLARAIELDGHNLEARLAFALGYESHGDYEEALRELDALASFGSWDDEVRLRRGVLLRRLGRPDEAAGVLERLIAGSAEAWIVTLAYQELARIHVAQDRPAAAVTALEQAARRFPHDGTLLLQLAYALDRQGRSDRAIALLERADRATDPRPDPLPRTRYHRGLDFVGGRSELLATSAVALLPVLASALESTAGSAAGRS